MITLSTLASNHALAALIEAYNECTYEPGRNKQCVDDWSNTLNHLNDAIQAFANDAARLEEYISGQR